MAAVEFDHQAARMAEFIRKGGLNAGPGWSQVKPMSYEPLAKINDQGMITVNSQDGIAEHFDGRTFEMRPYVYGFMKRDHASEFVSRFNMYTDMVAMLLGPVRSMDRWIRDNSYIIMTRVKDSEYYGAPIPVYWRPSGYEEDKTHRRIGAGLSASNDAVMVMCFDPKWNRRATNSKGTGLFDLVAKHLKDVRKHGREPGPEARTTAKKSKAQKA